MDLPAIWGLRRSMRRPSMQLCRTQARLTAAQNRGADSEAMILFAELVRLYTFMVIENRCGPAVLYHP